VYEEYRLKGIGKKRAFIPLGAAVLAGTFHPFHSEVGACGFESTKEKKGKECKEK
jgi:hypothetical protein